MNLRKTKDLLFQTRVCKTSNLIKLNYYFVKFIDSIIKNRQILFAEFFRDCRQ